MNIFIEINIVYENIRVTQTLVKRIQDAQTSISVKISQLQYFLRIKTINYVKFRLIQLREYYYVNIILCDCDVIVVASYNSIR